MQASGGAVLWVGGHTVLQHNHRAAVLLVFTLLQKAGLQLTGIGTGDEAQRFEGPRKVPPWLT